MYNYSKVYTFYQPIKAHTYQEEIVKLWQQSWQRNGYEPVVCNINQAISHSLFYSLTSACHEICEASYERGINAYELSTLARWLAWSTQLENPSLVMDYDVINLSYSGKAEIPSGLILHDGFCPCCCSADSSSSEEFVATVTKYKDTIIDYLKSEKNKDKTKAFHDQRLLAAIIGANIPINFTQADLPIAKSLEDRQPLIHYSHKLLADESLPAEEKNKQRLEKILDHYHDRAKIKLLVKVPSYARPNRLLKAIKGLCEHAKYPSSLCILISLNTDDKLTLSSPALEEIKQIAKDSKVKLRIKVSPIKSKVEAYNADIYTIASKFDAIVLASDDIEPLPGYDAKIQKAFAKQKSGKNCLYWFTTDEKAKTNLFPVIGTGFYFKYGYVYYPAYRSYYCDDDLTQTAFVSGKLVRVKEEIFTHLIPEPMRMSDDITYLRNMPDLERDKATFKLRRQAGFGEVLNPQDVTSFSYTPFDLPVKEIKKDFYPVHTLTRHIAKSEIYLLENRDRDIQGMPSEALFSLFSSYYDNFKLEIPHIIHQFDFCDSSDFTAHLDYFRDNHSFDNWRYIRWTNKNLKALDLLYPDLLFSEPDPCLWKWLAVFEVLNKFGGIYAGSSIVPKSRPFNRFCFPRSHGSIFLGSGESFFNELFGITIANPLAPYLLRKTVDAVTKTQGRRSLKANQLNYLLKDDSLIEIEFISYNSINFGSCLFSIRD